MAAGDEIGRRVGEARQHVVAVGAPGTPDLDDFEPGLVVTVQELVGDSAGAR